MLSSARGSRTGWRSTSHRSGSSASRNAGSGRFCTAWRGRNAGSIDRERPWLISSFLAARDRDDGRPEQLLPFRVAQRRDGQLELFTTVRRSLRLVRGHSAARQWLLFGRVARRWEQDPERAMRRAVFRLASRAMPKPMREVIWLLRGLYRVSGRQR